MGRKKQNVLIGITSGIAAYKISTLIEQLKKQNVEVEVMITQKAMQMIDIATINRAGITKIHNELFPKDFNYKTILKKREVDHIKLADWANVICIAPATANVIAKIAHGIADDFLTTTLLAATSPIILCPSMNVNMLNNPAVQENLETLRKRGLIIIPPERGDLACGYEGIGRLPQLEIIEKEIINTLKYSTQFQGKKVVVTAGGTSEKIDSVRVITNKSSGKMGIALTNELVKRGAEVVLIRGNTTIGPSVNARLINVSSSDEMLEAVQREVKNADIIIHAAAVSDFKVENEVRDKLDSKNKLFLKLIPTQKIIEKIKTWKPNIFLVAFKAESNVSEKEMTRKVEALLSRAQADMVVANDVGKIKVFGSDQNEVTVYLKNKNSILLPLNSKREITRQILDILNNSLYETS